MTAALNVIHESDQHADVSWFAFAANENSARIFRSVFADSGFVGGQVIVADMHSIVAQLETIPTPKILLVDMSETHDLMRDVEKLSDVCDPDTKVVLIGSDGDLATYRKLLNAGVADYLVTPVTSIEVSKTLERLISNDYPTPPSQSSNMADKRGGQTIAVVGVRGGVGASTMAANIAWIASETGDEEVVLIDFDLWFGAQSLNFDIEPGNGLFEAVSEPDRIDDLFIKRASVRTGERLSVMACEGDLKHYSNLDNDGFWPLISNVRGTAGATIVDLPRAQLLSDVEQLENFDQLILVTDPTLISMRDASRLIRFLNERVSELPVRLVLNKVGRASKYELDEKTFSQSVEHPISAKIPFDEKSILAAEATGKCVASAQGKQAISKSIKTLTDSLTSSTTEASTDKPRRNHVLSFLMKLDQSGSL